MSRLHVLCLTVCAPQWAREYGSGNSGEEGGWVPVRWRERVRQAAARAEEEERQARRDLDEEMRMERCLLYTSPSPRD